jgi:small-conductance mechanosensitive channel
MAFHVHAHDAPTSVVRDVLGSLYARSVAAAPGIVTGTIVFVVFLAIAAIVRAVISSATRRVGLEPTVSLLASRVISGAIVAFGLLTALAQMGLNVSALIAGLGLTGFALGFALKDVFANLVAGVMVLVYRPFALGDEISVAGQEGCVQEIRLRDTMLRHADGALVFIPNAKLVTEVVINKTERSHHRLRGSRPHRVPSSAG